MKNRDKVPSSAKYAREGLPPTNAIPLPLTPNGMNFERVESEEYNRIVEEETHREKEYALPSDPKESFEAMQSRDWLYEMNLRRQVEQDGRLLHRPMANRKALHDRYDTDD